MKNARLSSLQWLSLLPVLGMVAFVGVMAAFFWYLHRGELEQQRQTLYRDVEWAQQNMSLRWKSNQDIVVGSGTAWVQLSDAASAAGPQVRDLLKKNPDLGYVYWMDGARVIRWTVPADGSPQPSNRPLGQVIEDAASFSAFTEARDLGSAVYSPPFVGDKNEAMIELHHPVFEDKAFMGTIVLGYNLNQLLQVISDEQMRQRYKVDLLDAGGNRLASTSTRSIHDSNFSYTIGLSPLGYGISLRVFLLENRPKLLDRVLLTSVFGLSALILCGLGLLWYSVKGRAAIEQALAEETSFRRAMEDSISTGMRTMDMTGKITYVNPAFCKMLGFTEAELVNQVAPYRYWPKEQYEIHWRNLRQLLAGELPASGLRTEVQRKDGTRFFSRMYVSPLLDRQGKQTGWMTSMTDITEPERIREQLTAAYEQFTTVMEQLDAAVCVVNDGQLLFNNGRYQSLFGSSLHASVEKQMADAVSEGMTQPSHGSGDFVLNEAEYELRWRAIRWVDQSAAVLVLISDVTLRNSTQALQREQQERLEKTSRLIAMGEMASSLAHELNQPLTAIANYTMGGSARLQASIAKKEAIPVQDLATMLEKTARQAERAGKVVQRIRNFVKRSIPTRRACSVKQILEDAMGLAEIDGHKLQVGIRLHTMKQMPDLFVDPILIEQVLLNLLKNAIEATRFETQKKNLSSVADPLVEIVVEELEADIQVTILDRGSGVAEVDREKLFDPFFTTKPDGMGMGLNICRTIVEFHHGRLWFTDRPEGGTAFHLRLPSVLASAPPDIRHLEAAE